MTRPSSSSFHAVDPEEGPPTRTTSASLTHRPSERYVLDVRAVASGPVRVEESRCTDSTHLHRSDADDAYVIAVPLRGAIRATCRGEETNIGPGRAAVFGPRSEAEVDTGDDHDHLTVRIDATALEDALVARLGTPVRRPLRLGPSMALDGDAGRRWAGLMQLVGRSTGPGGALSHPAVAAPLFQAVFDAVLDAVTHPYRDALDAPVRSWAPHAVRDELDAIEARPDRPFTTATLATDAGTSVRALQESWLRHLDVPLGYSVRRARLGRAHGDLVDHSPGDATVAGIGCRWGYARPVGFAADYTRRYGLPPYQTLRGPSYA